MRRGQRGITPLPVRQRGQAGADSWDVLWLVILYTKRGHVDQLNSMHNWVWPLWCISVQRLHALPSVSICVDDPGFRPENDEAEA